MNKPPLVASPDFARSIELAVEVEKDSWVGEIGQEFTTVTVIVRKIIYMERNGPALLELRRSGGITMPCFQNMTTGIDRLVVD